MPRKKLLRTPHHPYHVTTRSNHKTWFSLPLEEVWSLALESLITAYKKHPVEIHAFVLMSNHYHLVLVTPNSDIDKFMYEFNKNFSLLLRKETNKINRMFGGRYKWSILYEEIHYQHVMKYVLRNPVKAGLCKNVEDYPYSTLNSALEKGGASLPVCPYFDLHKYLPFFNALHENEQNQSIKRGLNRGKFRFSGSVSKRKPPLFDKYVLLAYHEKNGDKNFSKSFKTA